jgi:N-acyl-L-homoserine lactone synthetase
MASFPDSAMDEMERERYLAGIDTAARTIVERAAPIRFAVAASTAEREAIWRLRADTVIHRGWAPPESFPDGMERDHYDDRAVHIAGWDGDVLAATARIVLPSPDRRSPIETHFGVTVEPRGQVANLDRMIVAPAYSDAHHRILMGLAFACWLELRRCGYHMFAGAITPGIVRLYRRAGWRATPLGQPQMYWAEERTPCQFDPFAGFTQPIGCQEPPI